MAADVARDDAHGVLGHAEHDREVYLRTPRAARARVQRVEACRRIVLAHRRARFQRHARHAWHPRLEARDVRGPRERSRRAFSIARQRVEADVRLRIVEHAWRIGTGRRGGVGDGRQDLVVDVDKLRRVLCRADRFRDHHRDRFADVADLVDRQRVMRRREHGRAVRVLERNVRGVRRKRAMRNRFDAVFQHVAARQDSDDAMGGACFSGVDASQPGVRMRRAQDDGVGLSGKVHVVAETAGARDEPQVFFADDRLADACASGGFRHKQDQRKFLAVRDNRYGATRQHDYAVRTVLRARMHVRVESVGGERDVIERVRIEPLRKRFFGIRETKDRRRCARNRNAHTLLCACHEHA